MSIFKSLLRIYYLNKLKIKKYKDQIYFNENNFHAAFDRYECIFIHVPKSAGTSICKTLFGYQIGHQKYTDYFNSNPQKTEQYFKFTFVRNPWDRLVSAYTYMKYGSSSTVPDDKNWFKKNISQFDNFGSFVKGWINISNIYKHDMFIPQFEFLCNEEGIIKMDFVGRFENLTEDYEFIRDILQLERKLPVTNSSNRKHYSEYYDDESIEIVKNVYWKDIALFNYTYNE